MLPILLTGCGLVGKGERRVSCVWMHHFTYNQISRYSFYLLAVFVLTRVPERMWAITLLTMKSHITHFTHCWQDVGQSKRACAACMVASLYLQWNLTLLILLTADRMWASPKGCALHVWMPPFTHNEISHYSSYSLLTGCGPVQKCVHRTYGWITLHIIKFRAACGCPESGAGDFFRIPNRPTVTSRISWRLRTVAVSRFWD